MQKPQFPHMKKIVYCSNCIIASLIVVNKSPIVQLLHLIVGPLPAGIHDKGLIGLMNGPRLKSESRANARIPLINIHSACHVTAAVLLGPVATQVSRRAII